MLLSATLLLTAIPFTTVTANTIISGTTGDCTWNLNDTELTISGNGAMADYYISSKLPWGTSISKVIIENGVTHIGKFAFLGCGSLTSVIISNSVIDIGDNAFDNCTSLTSITIPNGVTNIGSSAFWNCCSLTSITIPSSVTHIKKSAFSHCSALKNVYINDIASWCNISFKESYSSPLYYADNLYLNEQLITDLVIPSNVTEIPIYAFSCNNIVTVTIPDSVTSISDKAFYKCNSLSCVTIPESVINIGSEAFLGCKSLENVYITDIAKWCNINFYNYEANPLYYANNLYINNKLENNITIPNGVENIPAYAFSCDNIVSVTIPDSVKNIGSSAFYMCSSLNSVTLSENLNTIPSTAFYYCSSLTYIKIPENITTIGRYAFAGCNLLTSISLPKSITNIESSAFFNCKSLKDIYYTGVEESWKNITIESNNTYLLSANIHFDFKFGDADGDGIVNATDLTVFMKTLFSNLTIGINNLIKFDINGDGNFNIIDIVKLNKIILNIL